MAAGGVRAAFVIGAMLVAFGCDGSEGAATGEPTTGAPPACAGATRLASTSWTPPAGIPMPEFGVVERAPFPPDPWSVPTRCFYFVDASHALASDEDNPLGTPDRPRSTVPNDLPPGSTVELRGDYDVAHQSPRVIHLRGTAEAPVFVRGAPDARPRITRPWEIYGSYYILEHLEFADRDGTQAGELTIGPGDHAVLRSVELHGNRDTGGLAISGLRTAGVSHVLVMDNRIHDNGDVEASYDQDVHGIAVGSHVEQLWVVDNELFRNSGDGIQINGHRGGEAVTHHIWVGRNVAWGNKQTGFWTKQASDVVFSENECRDHRPSNSSLGQCMGFQYAPERVWFLFNRIHDCDFGIAAASDNDLGTGEDSYYVGNVIWSIHHSGDYNPATAWSNAAIMLAGGTNRWIVDNTIHDVDAGINSPSSGGMLRMEGNIISGIAEPNGRHAFIEFERTADRSTFRHNLLGETPRIEWGGSAPSADATVGTAAGDPGFISPPSNLDLRPDSRAVDAGTTSPVYSSYRQLYGIGIERDVAGRPRPTGLASDIGAYESGP